MNAVPLQRTPTVTVVTLITGWMLTVVWLSVSGALARMAERFMPAFALLVALGIVTPVVVYRLVPAVRAAVDSLGLFWLTAFHLWRIPAALLFFAYGLQGQLPGPFWVLAGVGDLLAGAFAMTLLWRERTVERYRHIHLFGFADFVVAVGTGLTFTLLKDPRMALLTTLPMALIPLFGVGLSGASHLISLAMLRRGVRR